ncbi:MAG: hypothetical protein RSC97_10735, partial [Eubacterium sp.]
AKKELRQNLAEKSKKVETATELRTLNDQIEEINNEMNVLDQMIKEADEREKKYNEMEHRELTEKNNNTVESKAEYRAIAKMLLDKGMDEEERALVIATLFRLKTLVVKCHLLPLVIIN